MIPAARTEPAPVRMPFFGLAPWAAITTVLSLLALALVGPQGALFQLLLAIALGGAIMAAVYHAEVLAHYLGEPFGTLTLALAVTVIETALIVSIMLGDGAAAQTLARDTLIAAIMITINAIVDICLLVGGTRHHEQSYTQSGVSVGLAMLATLAMLTLVLPNYTVSERGPFYSASQLAFVAIVSLVIYATFVVAQTLRHRDHFLHGQPDDHAHEEPVSPGKARAASVMLALTLFVASLTLGTGRTTIVQGVIHLVLFATYLFIALVP